MAEIVEILDFKAPELDIYARLTEAEIRTVYEPKKGLFIAESPNVIERALDDGYVPESLLLERKHIDGKAKALIERCGDIPVYTADLEILTQLTGFPLTRGVLCAMRRRELPSVGEVLRNAKRIAVLEDVMNPTNLGAIFRSAAALGMDAVLITPGSTDPLYRRAARVSMGTVFQIPWTVIGEKPADWPEKGLEILRCFGYTTISMALSDDSITLSDERLKQAEKLAIILGTEGDGLSARTIADTDYTVRIPMTHGVDSLNVAAAAAVAFWELSR